MRRTRCDLDGDAFDRNLDVPREIGSADVEQVFDFDITIGGRNATFFE